MPLRTYVFKSIKTTIPNVLCNTPVLLKWNIISPLANIFFQTLIQHGLNQQIIHKWMHISSITLWWVIFMFVICTFSSTGNKVLAKSLGMIWTMFQWSRVLFFLLGFCLVNFERDAYLAVDHSLAYSKPKKFLLSFQPNLDYLFLF